MLKIYCIYLLTGLCLLLTGPVARAQRGIRFPPVYLAPEETPWSHLVDSLTTPLDKSRIASGILYDRALPLAALHSFGARQIDTTSGAHLRQAYLELWIAAYNRATFRLTPDQFRERANRTVRHDSVPLAVLDYQFHWIDTLAVQDGLLTVQNGVLYDVAAPSRSPYLLRNLTLAAPLVDTLRQYTATFVLPPALLLTNRTRQVSAVTVDFNDGGPKRSLLPGQALSITYPSNGRKVVWFTVQFNDGSAVQLRSSIYVKAPTVSYRSIPVTLANLGTVEARIPFQNYNSTISLFGQGEVLAVLHHPASQGEFDNGQPVKLRRPVIVMDGFDPQDKSALFKNDRGDTSVYNGLKSKHILELLDEQHLQRDLIILNFPVSPRRTTGGTTTTGDVDGGADYIERNAFVLIELINQLKSRLDIDPATGQPYQFTIIGPSMGGLVSRYALAYMERQKYNNAPVPAGAAAGYWEHNTATWLSFDAPHQGAVVPMGDQAYLQFFQGIADAARETLNTNLYSPAAKQMLVHHVLAPGTTPAGAPGFRDRFMLALRDNGEPGSLGYPVHLRRVALANGRLDGKGDPGGTPCGKMFDMDVRLRTGNAIVATVVSLLLFPITHATAPVQIAACTARYAPAPGTSCPVFEGVLRYGIYGYSFPGSGYITPIYGRRVVDSGSQGSYDLAPGGLRDTQASLKRQAEAGGRTGARREQAYKVEVTNVAANHCFIPTVSALGYQYQTMSSYQNTGSLPDPYANLLARNMACNNDTPFDDFYAPRTANSFHVTVPDIAARDFLVRELTPQVATPVFTAAPNAICPNGTNRLIFSVANCIPRAGQPSTTYSWTAGPGLQIVSGQGTPTVTVQSTAGYVGTATLQVVATRTGYVASAPVLVTILVADGYVDTELDLQGAQKVCPYSTVIVRVKGISVQPPYTWTETHYRNGVPRPAASFTTQNPEYAVSVGDETVDITVTAQSVCTGQNVAEAPRTITPYVDPNGGFYCDPYSFRVAPNPADDYVEVSTRPGNAPPAPPLPNQANPHAFQVRLHDDRGQVVATASTVDGLVRLNTAALRPGLYHLVIARGRQVVRRNLSVQH